MNENQIHTVEVTIEQLKETVKKADALNALAKNKDFQLVIDTGYFQDKAAELVRTTGMPEMEGKQDSILKSIYAIGELRQYFTVIVQMGNTARRELEQNEGVLEELHAEDLQGAG